MIVLYMRVNTLIIKVVYNMSEEQNNNRSWNYTLIATLKSINRKEAEGYKRYKDISWGDVDTNISERNKGYTFLSEFGTGPAICRNLLDSSYKGIGIENKFKEGAKYKRLGEFCKKAGIDIKYMTGEMVMASEIKGHVERIKTEKDYDTYKKCIDDERESIVSQIIDYMNSHDESDPVNIWFDYFKNVDKVRFVSELKGLYRELDKLDCGSLIEYRRKNPAALKELYNRLSKAAVDVAMIYSGEENLRKITKAFETNRKGEEQMEEAGVDNILK